MSHDTQLPTRILSRSVSVEICMVGELRVGNIGGFVAQNWDGILLSELDNIFVDVDARSSLVRGLVAYNQESSFSTSAIDRDREALKNVTGTTNNRNFVGYNNGRIIDSEGLGLLFNYIED